MIINWNVFNANKIFNYQNQKYFKKNVLKLMKFKIAHNMIYKKVYSIPHLSAYHAKKVTILMTIINVKN